MFLSVVILGRFTTETHAMVLLRQDRHAATIYTIPRDVSSLPRSFLSVMAWSSVIRSTLCVQRTVRGLRPAAVISLTHSCTFSRKIRPIGQLPNFGSIRNRQLSS